MGIKYNTKFAQKNDLTIHFTPIYETESYKSEYVLQMT